MRWIVIPQLGLVGAAVAQVVTRGPQMPDPVTLHFSIFGKTDDTSAPWIFWLVYLGGLGILTVSSLMVPFLMGKISDGALFLPNKDYWMDPARRDATRKKVNNLVSLFLVMTSALVVLVFELSIQANLSPSRQINEVTVYIAAGVWALVLGLMMFRSIKRFFKPPVEEAAQ